jgi:hemerythrin superfamily protein
MPTQRKSAKSAKKSSAAKKRSSGKTSASSRKSASKSRASTKSSTQRSRSSGSSRSAKSRGSRASGRQSSGSARRSKQPNALELLTEDHRNVQKMFRKAERLESDDAQLQEIVQTACAALTQHAELEEALFYPALRESGADEDLLDEAEVEHDVAKQLIAELEGMSAGDERYKAMFKVLGEYVNHHVEEEEGQIFRAARRAKLDLVAIGEEIMARKQEGAGLETGEEAGGARSGRRGSSGGSRARKRGSDQGESDEASSRRSSRGSETDDEDEDVTMHTGGDTSDDSERPGRGGRNALGRGEESDDDVEIDVETPGGRSSER